MTQEQNNDEDILLKLSMPGKSLRADPKDAPTLPEQPSGQPTQPASQQLSSSPTPAASPSPVSQPQRETNTVVPPANTPPQSTEAQDDILRKLSVKPKDYDPVTPPQLRESATRPEPGQIVQTPEEMRSNKPYVSTDHEVEHVKKLARNIYGSDMVQRRVQKK